MVAAKDQQRDESEVERQRQGREAKGRVPNAQFSGVLSRAHLISGAVVKL
jgi:hypothetical protein